MAAFIATLSIIFVSVNAAVPKVDFSRMGKVAVAGSFAGLDIYNSQNPTTSFDSSTSTIFLRSEDGGLTPIGSTNSGGAVNAGCFLDKQFYFGGSFDTVSGQSTQNIAAYDPSTSSFKQLNGGGLDGPVNAIHCDERSHTLWVGGSFNGPASGGSGFGGSVALYNTQNGGWSPAPFVGFKGGSESVETIVPNADGSSLLFTGSFITSFQSGGNNTLTSNPNVPQSSGATPYSSSLVPFPLTNAELAPSPSSSRSGLGDIDAILCPAGPDGPGNTWFAQEGFSAVITIRAFKQLNASGIRLGNSFFDGQSTTAFTVTSIPDNNVLTLTYNTPGTDESQPCTESCPLSLDSSVPYQDFIFSDGSITGVQIILTDWTGDGPGLHLLQLLSNGAFAPSVGPGNEVSCYAPGGGSVDTTGDWSNIDVFTSTPGTTQSVLAAEVPIGAPSSSSVTWNAYVSASGEYEVYLLVPGCLNTQDCDHRTSVDVTINPGGSIDPVTTTISERVETDQKVLIYSGLIIPSDSDFQVLVTLRMASQPEGPGADGTYRLIADRIVFELRSIDSFGGAGGSGGSGGSRRGFGFYEWPLKNSFGAIDATTTLPNTTQTALSGAGLALNSQIGGISGSSRATVNSVVVFAKDRIFLGGDFSLRGGWSNIVAYQNNGLAGVANNGVNGPISAMYLYGSSLFVGGAFGTTQDGAQSLSNIGVYNIATNQWSPLAGGVDGPVTSLGQADGKLIIAGNFSRILFDANQATPAGGFATWDIGAGHWTNPGGLLVGDITMVTNSTKKDDTAQYVAGRIEVYSKFAADGMASLENSKKGEPVIAPLSVRLAASATANPPPSSTSSPTIRRGWNIDIRKLVARQSTTPSTGTSNSSTPAVLAGTFWTNTTSSTQVVILGGAFNVPGSAAANLAVYDPKKETISALTGNQVDGIVRTLLVAGSNLYVGGEFTVAGVSGEGFAVYDLPAQTWSTSVPGLQATSGTVTVRSIINVPENEDVIIIAGSFTTSGSTQCQSLCAFNPRSQTWSALGSGIQGDVNTVAYGGDMSDKSDVLMAAGQFTLSGVETQVAAYSISNQTWAALGTLPGEVAALSVNDRNTSSVFVAGQANQIPFVSYWNGAQWSAIDVPLSEGTNITQLEMVPLSEEHDVNGIIQRNRMLWVSGSLRSNNFNDISSALYDGQTLHPYLVTSTFEGEPGSVSSLFRSFQTFSFNARRFLATGVVILISIALGAGIVFLLGLLGILWALFGRRDDRSFGQETVVEDDDSMQRPSSLLAHVTAATRHTIMGTPGTPKDEVYVVPVHKGEETAVDDHVAGAAIAADDGVEAEQATTTHEHDVNRPARVRYSFDGTGEGELPLSTGAEVVILNDHDPTWWYVREKDTNREGIVPSSYLA